MLRWWIIAQGCKRFIHFCLLSLYLSAFWGIWLFFHHICTLQASFNNSPKQKLWFICGQKDCGNGFMFGSRVKSQIFPTASLSLICSYTLKWEKSLVSSFLSKSFLLSGCCPAPWLFYKGNYVYMSYIKACKALSMELKSTNAFAVSYEKRKKEESFLLSFFEM